MSASSSSSSPVAGSSMTTLFQPSFLQRLADPEVKTVLMCGCGGGFDFVHGQILYPELMRLGKTVVLASYTFSGVSRFADAKPYWNYSNPKVPVSCVLINGNTKLASGVVEYAPDLLVCRYLDAQYPQQAPHSMYTMYARDFCIKSLHELYSKICKEHKVDAVIIIDGGTDSLMAGDEAGLGDPLEDAVSVGAVHQIKGLRWKTLISVGFGCDRFNDVSDASSLRAVAELTRMGGFLGSFALEPTNPCFQFYKNAVEFLDKNENFRSVLATSIIHAGLGWYGDKCVPPSLKSRVRSNRLFLWPLMSQLWGFDIDVVVKRSFIIPVIKDCDSVLEMTEALRAVVLGKKKAKRNVSKSEESSEAGSIPKTFTRRELENLPKHEDFSIFHAY